MEFKIKELKNNKWRLRYQKNGKRHESIYDHFEDLIFYIRTLIRR